ncbi:MAG: hypothetical protein V1887_03835 [Candidatus Aenigmatarchaeota archaeon]
MADKMVEEDRKLFRDNPSELEYQKTDRLPAVGEKTEDGVVLYVRKMSDAKERDAGERGKAIKSWADGEERDRIDYWFQLQFPESIIAWEYVTHDGCPYMFAETVPNSYKEAVEEMKQLKAALTGIVPGLLPGEVKPEDALLELERNLLHEYANGLTKQFGRKWDKYTRGTCEKAYEGSGLLS